MSIYSRLKATIDVFLHGLSSGNKKNNYQKLAACESAPSFYKDDIFRRDELLRNIFGLMNCGMEWLSAICNPAAASHGERVAEYAFVASLIRDLNPRSIMDVGGVLNNPVIVEQIENKRRIYFLNPAVESVIYSQYAYFKSSLSAWNEIIKFPMVTCLSTLEHIGFDNTRYGVCETDQGWDWPECIQSIVSSIETLLTMVEPGGQLLVSCPYGCREYVLHPPRTGVRTAQVLNYQHVCELMRQPFAHQLKFLTIKLTKNGWEKCEPDGEYQPYGGIGPGASGLIFILGRGV